MGVPVVSAWCWFGVVAGSGVEMVGAGVEVVGACVMGMCPGVAAGGAGGREAASASKWRASGGPPGRIPECRVRKSACLCARRFARVAHSRCNMEMCVLNVIIDINIIIMLIVSCFPQSWYAGETPTTARETVSYYENLRSCFIPLPIAGYLGGILSWAITYRIIVIV